jgi:hypothetical protein
MSCKQSRFTPTSTAMASLPWYSSVFVELCVPSTASPLYPARSAIFTRVCSRLLRVHETSGSCTCGNFASRNRVINNSTKTLALFVIKAHTCPYATYSLVLFRRLISERNVTYAAKSDSQQDGFTSRISDRVFPFVNFRHKGPQWRGCS